MFDKQEFIKSVFKISELPKDNLPQILLCGRSNVGKSSFINSFFNRKNLAKISSTPGKTRSINFYKIDDKFYFVDLPGYGYAKTSLKEREEWGRIVSEYFSNFSTIILALHFVDSRIKPGELDLQLNELLKYNGIQSFIIVNKVDKLNQSEIASSKKIIKELFPDLIQNGNVFFYSSKTKRGKKEIKIKMQEIVFQSLFAGNKL